MSATQNLAYALVQVLHNLGAVAAVGGSLAAVASEAAVIRKKTVWIALSGWVMQGASGAALGAVSYYFYGRFPDISGIALFALMLKMACAVTGFALLVTYLYRGERWAEDTNYRVFLASLVLAITAISSAAFLRWFS
jgi:NADH:ubiquinone oxidoreductase subunit K